MHIDDGRYGDENTISGFYERTKIRHKCSHSKLAHEGWIMLATWKRQVTGHLLWLFTQRNAPQRQRWIIMYPRSSGGSFSGSGHRGTVYDTLYDSEAHSAFPRLVRFLDLLALSEMRTKQSWIY